MVGNPHPPQIMTRLCTVTEAAKLLGIDRTTVIRHIKMDRLKAIVMDGQYFIRADDVEKLRGVVERSLSERMKQEVKSRKVPQLYKLCVDDKFEEVARLLNLPEQPSSVSDCFSIVNKVMKQKVNKI